MAQPRHVDPKQSTAHAGDGEAAPNYRLTATDDITGELKRCCGALSFPPNYKPAKSCADSMFDAVPLFEAQVPQIDFIIEDALFVAESLVHGSGPLTTVDQCFAIVLFTYDIGVASRKEDHSDNFCVAFNKMLKNSDTIVLERLRPYLYYLKEALDGIPPETKGAVFYRGVPKASSAQLKDYQTGGKVHFPCLTSLSRRRDQAEKVAGKDGIVIEITTSSAVGVAPYSMFSKQDDEEVLLRPDTALNVLSGIDNATFAKNRVISLVQEKGGSKPLSLRQKE